LETDAFYSTFAGISVHSLTTTALISAIISLTVSLLLLSLSALISASEVAFFSLDPQSTNELEESELKADKNIVQLLQRPQHLLATILIANNFLNVAVILLLTNFTTSILNFESAPFLGFIFQAIFITFVLLLFGEIMPKVYATQYSKKTTEKAAPLIMSLEKMFGPVINLLVNSTSVVNTRLSKHTRSNISMDELSHALELTSNSKDEDTEILEGIIKFWNIKFVDIIK